MREAERCGNFAGDLGGLHGRNATVALHDVGKRSALHVFHRDEIGAAVLAPVVDAHDVGMVQVGGGLRLAAEAFDEVWIGCELRKQDLDCNGSVEQQVARQQHVGHASAPNARFDLVPVVEDRSFTAICHCCLPDCTGP